MELGKHHLAFEDTTGRALPGDAPFQVLQSVVSDPEGFLPKAQRLRAIDSSELTRSSVDASKGDQPLDLELQRGLHTLTPSQRTDMPTDSTGHVSESTKMDVLLNDFSKIKEEEDLCSHITYKEKDIIVSRLEDKEAIKILIGATAGLEPETLLRVKNELESLKRMVSITQPEMMKAIRNVDELISKHVNCTGGKNNLCFDDSLLPSEIPSYNGIFLGNLKEIQNFNAVIEPSISKLDSISQVESLKSIQSKIELLVEFELQRAKDKKKQWQSKLKKQDNEMKRNRFVDCMNVVEDDDSGDEMDIEESIMFLEAFKIDSERTVGNKFSYKENDLLLKTENNGKEKEVISIIDKNESRNEDNFESKDAETTPISKAYSYPMESDLKPGVSKSLSMKGEENFISSIIDDQNKDGHKLSRAASTWWSTDSSLASDVLRKLKQALEFSDKRFATGVAKRVEEIKALPINHNVARFELSIEQAAMVLSNISSKIDNIFLCEQNNNSCNSKWTKLQLSNIAGIFLTCLDYAFDYDFYSIVKDEHQVNSVIQKTSETFSSMSEILNKAPPEIKHFPLSCFDPPQSISKVLSLLYSTEYFESCFVTYFEQVNNNEYVTADHSAFFLDKSEQSNEGTVIQNAIEIYSQDSACDETSTFTASSSFEKHAFERAGTTKQRTRRSLPLKSQDPANTKVSLEKYKNHLLLSPEKVTVEDFSYMLLLMSSVLNDLPSECKSTKFLDLNPPLGLIQGLEIIYTANDIEPIAHVQRNRSFASLTLQDVTDFTLTVSKNLYDAPPHLKQSIVVDMNPPNSLLNAVTLFTSFLYNSEVDRDGLAERELTDVTSSQDKFFDAVESLSSAPIIGHQ